MKRTMLLVLFSSIPVFGWDEFVYAQQRITEMYSTRTSSFSGKISLTDDEDCVDRYVEYLKGQDTLNWTLNWGYIHGTPHGQAPPYARYWDKTTRSMIESSAFYQNVVRTLPKGGNLHVHDGARADRLSVLKQYINDPNLYVRAAPEDQKGHLSWFVGMSPPSKTDWIPASKWSLADHENYLMITSLTYHEDNKKYEAYPWKDFGHAYTRWDNFAWYEKVYYTWVNESIQQAMKDNVQYLEVRAAFGKIYNSNSSYSKDSDSFTPIDTTGQLELGIWAKILKAANPDYFFDLRAIYQVGRTVDASHLAGVISKAASLAQSTKGQIVGFDLVGGEDNGKPDMEYLKELGAGSDKIPFMLHAGETSWGEDAADPSGVVNPIENLYEAVLLGAKRIGHALALAKNPQLLNLVKKNNICVELCPISNNVLGFIRDLRQHPGISYLRQGVQGVIASDDAGLFGSTLSMDFYQAWHAWGLRLYDIKQLILNSFTCSGLTDKEKADYIKKWTYKWDSWIQKIKTQACEASKYFPNKFFLDHQYTTIMPSRIPLNKPSDVLIMNRNITYAVCPPKILCRFGEFSTGEGVGKYIGPSEVLCNTKGSQFAGTEPVYLSIDNGKNWLSTGSYLRYG